VADAGLRDRNEMKLIIITAETFFDGEFKALNRLFAGGLELLHVRKPGACAEHCGWFIRQINSEYHSRLVLHDCYELADEFNLKGIHLNGRNGYAQKRIEGLTFSRSCHTFEEVKRSDEYDCLFLSPVFDSVSKTGYSSRFTSGELMQAKTDGIISERVIALGGITLNRIEEVRQYGFGGVALIGALWKEFPTDRDLDGLLKRFDELESKCREQ
jgi:thiamine-phosphate pyrophosphorylase